MDKRFQLELLAKEICSCEKCLLHKTRNQAVPGEGSPDAKIFFIAEAPGGNEDLSGRPFTGRSGKIIDLLLVKFNLKREEIFLSNIVKCRPPQNRDPSIEEISACKSYLFAQIGIVQPQLIVALGRFAASELFRAVHLPFASISEERGVLHRISASYGFVNVIALLHPAAICYNPHLLQTMQKDLKTAIDAI